MRTLALLLVMLACSPVELPVVEVSPLDDTASTAGPYPVAAAVRARRPVKTVELVWHNIAAGGGTLRVRMTQDDAGVWRASIPGYGRGARIAYHAEAVDEEADRGAGPEAALGASGCGPEYCFSVLPAP